MKRPPRYYKFRTVASLLPNWVLNLLIRHWKLDYDPADGWTFWLDASYVKWCRKGIRHAKLQHRVRTAVCWVIGHDEQRINFIGYGAMVRCKRCGEGGEDFAKYPRHC